MRPNHINYKQAKVIDMGIYCLALLCLMLASYQTARADHVDVLYEKAAKRYHQLYVNKSIRQDEDNWIRTIKQFQSIYKSYPDHKRAEQALFNMGKLYRAYYKKSLKEILLNRSNITFRTLIRDYPDSYLADDAQYLIAENYEVYKKDKNLAYWEYKKVLDNFPNSDSIENARVKMVELQQIDKNLPVVPVASTKEETSDLTQIRMGGGPESEYNADTPLVQVANVDYWSTSDWSRMVINTKGKVRYRYQVLKKDRHHNYKRIYIDVLHAYIPEGFKKTIAVNDGLITRARIAQYDSDTVRIVMDLVSLEKRKVFHLSLPNQYKIVIDLLGDKRKKTLPKTKIEKPSAASKKATISLPEAFALKVRRIILDPGHGGKDPGANIHGVNEKDLALRIGLSLRRIIQQKNPEIKVYMTRTTDKYVALDARTAFANKKEGDLFVSIHINASPQQTLSGIETYYLNLTTDDEALSLAAKENQTSLKSISDLQSILNDLMTNSKILESSKLADVVHSSLMTITNKTGNHTTDLGVKKAPFIVLLGAQMPSILIEAGFLTNDDERNQLQTAKYRRIVAEGIYRGIVNYMN
jgi:N-acetylmuramoyl-L-alanine amidase